MAKKLTHPSPKVIETYEMLRSGKPVTVDSMVSRLGCKTGTLMVHICQLRGHFAANIKNERNGRKVISYLLVNPSEVAPYMVSKAKKTKASKVAKVAVVKTKSTVSRKKIGGEVPTIDSEYDITEISDLDLTDLKLQLGHGRSRLI